MSNLLDNCPLFVRNFFGRKVPNPVCNQSLLSVPTPLLAPPSPLAPPSLQHMVRDVPNVAEWYEQNHPFRPLISGPLRKLTQRGKIILYINCHGSIITTQQRRPVKIRTDASVYSYIYAPVGDSNTSILDIDLREYANLRTNLNVKADGYSLLDNIAQHIKCPIGIPSRVDYNTREQNTYVEHKILLEKDNKCGRFQTTDPNHFNLFDINYSVYTSDEDQLGIHILAAGPSNNDEYALKNVNFINMYITPDRRGYYEKQGFGWHFSLSQLIIAFETFGYDNIYIIDMTCQNSDSINRLSQRNFERAVINKKNLGGRKTKRIKKKQNKKQNKKIKLKTKRQNLKH